jgi:hypothetical protein
MTDLHIPEAFKPVNGLGARRAYFPIKKWNRHGNLVICLLLLLVTIIHQVVGLKAG